jgi:hypothetical protein
MSTVRILPLPGECCQSTLTNRTQLPTNHPVMINQSGPYDFLVDTGSQVTIVDPSLAAELHLEAQGAANVVGVTSQTRASLAQLNSLEVGSHAIAHPRAVLQDLSSLRVAGLRVRGILGEDFLSHFDLLIDNAHGLLCLDDTKLMRADIKGTRIPLKIPPGTVREGQLTSPLLIAVHLSGAGKRPLILKIDSGTNVSFLYHPNGFLDVGLSWDRNLRGTGVSGAGQPFTALPPQNLTIGSLSLPQTAFVLLPDCGPDSSAVQVDGLLATGLFRRILISYVDRFVVIEP